MDGNEIASASLATLACVLFLTGTVLASLPVDPVIETTAISSVTSMNVLGITVTTESVSWQQANGAIHDPPLGIGGWLWSWVDPSGNIITGYSDDPLITGFLGPAPPGELRYVAGYSESTRAVSGETSYTKNTAIDSASPAGDKSNIATGRIVTFVAAGGQGRMVSTEGILIDCAGTQSPARSLFLCPFSSDAGTFFPPFCTIVMTGSTVDVSLASVSTAAGERFVAPTADVPVEQSYSIQARGVISGFGSRPASGAINSFMTAHLQEGREIEITPPQVDEIPNPRGFIFVRSADITYENSAAASGLVRAFSQSYHYQDSGY